jgi:lysine decarboxylase
MLLEPAVFPRPTGAHDRALAQELAAEAWGAARAWLLPHGGAAAACFAVRFARGRQVVVQRDAGAAIVGGIVAAGLAPHWLAPELDPIAGIAHGVSPAALDAALCEAPGARAAIVVAPARHGAMPDIPALAAVAHCHGAALVVDAGHGGHLPFHPSLPPHPVAAGADLVLSGLGSLGAPAGAVALQLGPLAERWLPAAAVDAAVALCDQTDAAALAPLDAARACAAQHGERLLAAALADVATARTQLTGAPGVRVLGPQPTTAGALGFDPLRLTADLHDSRRDARAVARALRERGIATGLATDRLLVVELGIRDGDRRTATRFASALLDTLWRVPPAERTAAALPPSTPGPAICSPRAAWMAPSERVPAEAAVGRIAAETLTPYPPGVPAVHPGELLEAGVVAMLGAVAAAGGVVQGSRDGLGTFAVVAGPQGGAGRRPPGARRARAVTGRWTR